MAAFWLDRDMVRHLTIGESLRVLRPMAPVKRSEDELVAESAANK
jgi:hypothetical protein